MTQVRIEPPSTGYEQPDDASELMRLYDIACRAHPELRSETAQQQFGRAFFCVGHMWRLDAPSKKHDPSWPLQRANEDILEPLGYTRIESPRFFSGR